VVGSKPLPRPEVVSKVWDYIKKNNLQNPQNKREWVSPRGVEGSVKNPSTPGGRNGTQTTPETVYA